MEQTKGWGAGNGCWYPQHQLRKPNLAVLAYNPSAGAAEAGGSLGLAVESG